ncbi:hypothetical protein [Aestuariivivens insulae]|uniref:hypothetical protein n=1 Tax=Aestuariivivens insulae TaxID=1621988 RepID=UPI001F5761C5|nr:hypothetical protein [Aestuariivivens insulae]
MKQIIFLFFFFTTFTYCQDSFVTIQFQGLKFLEDGFKNTMFSFEINGVLIRPDTLKYRVPKVKEGFDVIRFSMDGKFRDNDSAYAKFRRNETYIIRINPCSQYEFLPTNGAKVGAVEFMSSSINEDLSLKFCVESVFFNRQNSKKTIKCIPSSMCRFSKKEVKILEDEEVLDSFYFHFLHGENLILSLMDKKLSFKIKTEH